MATDAMILAGWLDSTRGKNVMIEDACNALGWSVDRYLDALADLFRHQTK